VSIPRPLHRPWLDRGSWRGLASALLGRQGPKCSNDGADEIEIPRAAISHRASSTPRSSAAFSSAAASASPEYRTRDPARESKPPDPRPARVRSARICTTLRTGESENSTQLQDAIVIVGQTAPEPNQECGKKSMTFTMPRSGRTS
jgi:hypothetical protein